MKDDYPDPDFFVPDSVVCKEQGITRQTLWRYTNDPGLGFPPAIKIRNRNYRSRRALEDWKQQMLRRNLDTRAA